MGWVGVRAGLDAGTRHDGSLGPRGGVGVRLAWMSA